MKFRFRLIPVTLCACFLFMLLKIEGISVNQEYLARGLIPPAYAAGAEEEEKESKAPEEEEKSEDAPAEGGEAKESEEAAAPVDENPNVSLDPPEKNIAIEQQFNQIELDLLQSLSKRREEIDKYAEEVALREKLLEATEMRLEKKIKQMGFLKTELLELLERNEAKEDTEMKSLVKIYESMKPKDAARIFDELDMNILLEVVDRMSEKKAAPILASMSSTRAKDVTVKLAEMRQLRQQASKDLAQDLANP